MKKSIKTDDIIEGQKESKRSQKKKSDYLLGSSAIVPLPGLLKKKKGEKGGWRVGEKRLRQERRKERKAGEGKEAFATRVRCSAIRTKVLFQITGPLQKGMIESVFKSLDGGTRWEGNKA